MGIWAVMGVEMYKWVGHGEWCLGLVATYYPIKDAYLYSILSCIPYTLSVEYE